MSLFHWLKDFCGENQEAAVRLPDGRCSPLVRRRFRFSGRVQGVGFRYEARMTAGQLSLAGWVKNESDGTVVVEAEGAEARVAEFLRVMRSVPRFRITEVRSEDLPVSGAEASFRILY